MTTLHEQVKKAETEIKSTYAYIVKSFDAKLQTISDTRPQIGKPGPGTYPDQNLNELQERKERSKNLIGYEIPESTPDDGSNRRMHDQVHFQTICQEGMDLKADATDTIRLGEKKEGRSRPLRVKLADEATMIRVLLLAKNLARAEDILLHNTFIRRDRTPLERKEDYELSTELKQRREESKKKNDGIRWIIRKGKIVDVTPRRHTNES